MKYYWTVITDTLQSYKRQIASLRMIVVLERSLNYHYVALCAFHLQETRLQGKCCGGFITVHV
jgi:hypothetical protein